MTNLIGIKWTLAFGSIGYPLYAAGLYVNNRTGATWFVYFGSIACGVTAGFFWSVEGKCAVRDSQIEIVANRASNRCDCNWIPRAAKTRSIYRNLVHLQKLRQCRWRLDLACSERQQDAGWLSRMADVYRVHCDPMPGLLHRISTFESREGAAQRRYSYRSTQGYQLAR